jgi:hypothetical protein
MLPLPSRTHPQKQNLVVYTEELTHLESASQFNREYKRFFGQPPMRDIKVRRLAGSAMVSD